MAYKSKHTGQQIDDAVDKAIQHEFTIGNLQKAAVTMNADITANAEALAKQAKDLETKAPKVGYAPDLKVDFAKELVGRGVAEPQEIGTIRPTGVISIGDGNATIERVKGRSVVYNQFCDFNRISSIVNVTVEEKTINSITLSTYGVVKYARVTYRLPYDFANRKILITYKVKASKDISLRWGGLGVSHSTGSVNGKFQYLNDITTEWTNKAGIYSVTSASHTGLMLQFRLSESDVTEDEIFTLFVKDAYVYDLTQMFGAGNEPTTIEEFEARKPLGVTDEYNEGEIISYDAKELKSVGFNAFNGTYAKVIGGQQYHALGTITSIGFTTDLGGETTNVTLDSEGMFTPTESGFVYAEGSDICIHLAHTYTPEHTTKYEEDTLQLPNIKAIKDKDGNQLFPYGLLSAGNANDEVTATKAVKRIGVVDMGTLDYNLSGRNYLFAELPSAKDGDAPKVLTNCVCVKYASVTPHNIYNNVEVGMSLGSAGVRVGGVVIVYDPTYTDATTFKQAMSGVMLYYELKEPIEVDLPEPLNLTYEAWDFGTEELIAEGKTTPLNADIVYQFNAVDRIRENMRDIAANEDAIEKNEEQVKNISSFVSLIPSQADLPNIDTINKTLDLGEDSVLLIGKNRYVLKNIHADADVYRKILIYDPNLNTGALRIIFNEKTYKIEAKSYEYVLSDSECLIGCVRLTYGTHKFISANFPFKFTIDGVKEEDVVRTSVQELTENQKVQARENIGASDKSITDSLVETTTSLESFKFYNAQTRARFVKPIASWVYLRVNVLQIPDDYKYGITLGNLVNSDGYVGDGYDSTWISAPKSFNLSGYAKEYKYLGIAFRKKDDSSIAEEERVALIEGFNFEILSFSLNTLKEEVGSSLKGKTNLSFIAHRGVHVNGIPENSLDAYRYAGYCGFEYAETDFCPTADDELVLMHDASINRTMRNKADYSELTETVNVRDKTLAELRENYVLASSDVRMRREIPTLEEFFVTCKNSGVFPIPEIKTSGTTNDHVRKAYELGKKIMGEGNFGFCSFSSALLDYARSLSEKTLLLYINNGILGTTNTVTEKSRESNNTWWYPSYNGYGLTQEVVRQYKEAGIKVAVWTTPVSKFDDLLKMEVDCLAGDVLSPNIAGMYGFVAKSEIDFSKFETNGVRENKTVKLSNGQTLKYSAQNTWLGGYYLSVIGKGAFTITAPNLSVSVNLEKTDRLIYQGLVDNKLSEVTIKANANSVIEFVEFCSVNF